MFAWYFSSWLVSLSNLFPSPSDEKKAESWVFFPVLVMKLIEVKGWKVHKTQQRSGFATADNGQCLV